MMEYDAFILFLHQIASQRKAKVVIQGSVIFIEKTCRADQWSLSTQILGSHSRQLNSLLGPMFLRSEMRWQQKGAFLKIDQETGSLHLVQEVVSSKKYIPFKNLIQDFASVASEWKEILEESYDEENLTFRCI